MDFGLYKQTDKKTTLSGNADNAFTLDDGETTLVGPWWKRPWFAYQNWRIKRVWRNVSVFVDGIEIPNINTKENK